MPSLSESFAALVTRAWRTQQRLAETLAAHQQQVARIQQQRQELVTLRRQCRDTCRRRERLRRDRSPAPDAAHPLAEAMPGADTLVWEIAYTLFAARGLLTEAEAKSSMAGRASGGLTPRTPRAGERASGGAPRGGPAVDQHPPALECPRITPTDVDD